MQTTVLIKQRIIQIEKALDTILPDAGVQPEKLHRAMRYSVFSGGKRIRPILAIEACLCCGGKLSDVLANACAIELVHTFSLIHDDLPSMDNDDYRRGKPSCHKKFDEATAILAADALFALAFSVIASAKNKVKAAEISKQLANACGSRGMVGGQVRDLAHTGKKRTQKIMDRINREKTGELIKASLAIGGISAGAGKSKIKKVSSFGRQIGLVFQIIDDILDKEAKNRDVSFKQAARITASARRELDMFGKKAGVLCDIADFLLYRGK